MGCDGGSIPKRVEMVKLKKKDEKVRMLVVNTISSHTALVATTRSDVYVLCVYLYKCVSVERPPRPRLVRTSPSWPGGGTVPSVRSV